MNTYETLKEIAEKSMDDTGAVQPQLLFEIFFKYLRELEESNARN